MITFDLIKMEKLLIIDSCMRPESRTRKVLDAAKEVLSSRYDVENIDVNAARLCALTPETLAERSSGVVPESTVALARRIASADRIVIAAPFWDMSFPAALKAFFENMSLYGITFTDNGQTCTGLCRCKRVMYITTRGMNIETGSRLDQGSPYLQALSSLWGLGEVATVAAWNLDYSSPEEAEERVAEASSLAKTLALTF